MRRVVVHVFAQLQDVQRLHVRFAVDLDRRHDVPHRLRYQEGLLDRSISIRSCSIAFQGSATPRGARRGRGRW